jgi:hypothetical protein
MKFTRIQLFWLSTILFIAAWLLFAYLWNVGFPYDTFVDKNYLYEGKYKFGSIHTIFNFIYCACITIAYVVLLFGIFDEYSKYLNHILKDANKRDNDIIKDSVKVSNKPINYKKLFKWSTIIICSIFLIVSIKNITIGMINLYNKSVDYNYVYVQKVQSKSGFYDNMWKSYLQIDKNTNINKDVFIEVSKIIMENRKDGENVTWKWVQENQQIPFDEFTKFYTQLNEFIISKRNEYYNIEVECQKIAYENNKLLDIFPNNIYNKILKCKHIDFEYSFSSDKTNNVFSNKVENDIIQ